MHEIFYKDDFRLIVAFNKPIDAGVDFRGALYTPQTLATDRARFSRRGQVLTACSLSDDGSQLAVAVDGNRLAPGPLVLEMVYLVPSQEMPDGFRTVARRYSVDAVITSALPAHCCDSDDCACSPEPVRLDVEIPWQYVHDTDVYNDIIENANGILEEVLGDPGLTVLLPDEKKKLEAMVMPRFRAKYSGTFSYKYGYPFTNERWVECSAPQSDEDVTAEFPFIGRLMFNENQAVTEIRLPDLGMISGQSLFDGLTALTKLQLPVYLGVYGACVNTFKKCQSLTTLNLQPLDTSRATVMAGMFDGCAALTSLNLSGFDTSNVTQMTNMFRNCSSLKSLNLSNFNTSKVRTMGGMFDGCSALTSVNLAGFDMSKAAFPNMFRGCTALTTVTGPISGITKDLDLSDCPLTAESAMVFINGLSEATDDVIITFRSSTYNLLTSEQLRVAEDKDWMVDSKN